MGGRYWCRLEEAEEPDWSLPSSNLQRLLREWNVYYQEISSMVSGKHPSESLYVWDSSAHIQRLHIWWGQNSGLLGLRCLLLFLYRNPTLCHGLLLHSKLDLVDPRMVWPFSRPFRALLDSHLWQYEWSRYLWQTLGDSFLWWPLLAHCPDLRNRLPIPCDVLLPN